MTKNALEGFLHLVPVAIATAKGPDLVLDYTNKKFEEVFGEVSANSKLTEAVPELVDYGIFSYCQKVLETGEAVHINELRIISNKSICEPKEMYFNYSILPITTQDGKVDGVLNFVDDVTEFVKSRIEKEGQLSKAVSLLKLKEEMMKIAFHEIKTPITAISLCSQALKIIARTNPNLPDQCATAISSLHDSIRKLNHLAHSLLDVSETEEKIVLNYKDVNIQELVKRVVNEIQWVNKDCRIISTLPEEEINAFIDQYKIDQALTNLIQNAIKYSSGKPVEVNLDYSEHEFCIKVKDQGIGISKSDINRIFNKYERINPNDGFGFGLGLYLVKKIIEAHHGKILVESEEGIGSVFTIVIPRRTLDS